MSDPNAAAPIVVWASPTQPQIAAGLRQLIISLGSVAASLEAMGIGDKLHLSADLSNALGYVGAASAVIAFVWGQFETRKIAKKAAAMATALPSDIATTK